MIHHNPASPPIIHRLANAPSIIHHLTTTSPPLHHHLATSPPHLPTTPTSPPLHHHLATSPPHHPTYRYDLAKNRAVQEADAISYAESVGAAHIYTSAKQNKGLDESFGELTTSKCDM